MSEGKSVGDGDAESISSTQAQFDHESEGAPLLLPKSVNNGVPVHTYVRSPPDAVKSSGAPITWGIEGVQDESTTINTTYLDDNEGEYTNVYGSPRYHRDSCDSEYHFLPESFESPCCCLCPKQRRRSSFHSRPVGSGMCGGFLMAFLCVLAFSLFGMQSVLNTTAALDPPLDAAARDSPHPRWGDLTNLKQENGTIPVGVVVIIRR